MKNIIRKIIREDIIGFRPSYLKPEINVIVHF